MQRIRIYYSKSQALRYTGNLDVHKIWERTFRRAKLPLSYSHGFHPQPKLNQACPLPLGMTSRAEILDAWLESDFPVDEISLALEKYAPPGLEIQNIEPIDLCEPALQTQVVAAEYRASWKIFPEGVKNSKQSLAEKLDEILAAKTLPRTWKNKAYDLRPFILHLEFLDCSKKERMSLSFGLTAREGATGRPEELLSALGIDPFSAHIERVKLVFL